MIDANDIHIAIAHRWPFLLRHHGIGVEHLQNKHGPCPACGGNDRYRFDNRRARGDFYCNKCGPGDGFDLLQRVHGWSFAEARRRVVETLGIDDAETRTRFVVPTSSHAPAVPTKRVLRLLDESDALSSVADVTEYLRSRHLWPLPQHCGLRASRSVDYFHNRSCIGGYPAIIAPVRDCDGQLVTVHVTYLHRGRKLTEHPPRKLLSKLTGRVGCAVRLFPVDRRSGVLGIAEGVESALAANSIFDIPVWAAINTSLLAKFLPPSNVRRIVIFADPDRAGVEAAKRLKVCQQARIPIELALPPNDSMDWADTLAARTELRIPVHLAVRGETDAGNALADQLTRTS